MQLATYCHTCLYVVQIKIITNNHNVVLLCSCSLHKQLLCFILHHKILYFIECIKMNDIKLIKMKCSIMTTSVMLNSIQLCAVHILCSQLRICIHLHQFAVLLFHTLLLHIAIHIAIQLLSQHIQYNYTTPTAAHKNYIHKIYKYSNSIILNQLEITTYVAITHQPVNVSSNMQPNACRSKTFSSTSTRFIG